MVIKIGFSAQKTEFDSSPPSAKQSKFLALKFLTFYGVSLRFSTFWNFNICSPSSFLTCIVSILKTCSVHVSFFCYHDDDFVQFTSLRFEPFLKLLHFYCPLSWQPGNAASITVLRNKNLVTFGLTKASCYFPGKYKATKIS